MRVYKVSLSALLLGVLVVLNAHLALAKGLPYWDWESYASQNFEAVYQMKEEGIFRGYPDGSFKGDIEIQRIELAKVLVLAAGIKGEKINDCASQATKNFSDVVEDQWYTKYVYCGQAKGWLKGDDGTDKFRPTDPVLLSEAFKMIVESQYGKPDSSYAGTQWYQLYSNFLKDHEIITVESMGGDLVESYRYTYMGIGGYWYDEYIGFDSWPGGKITRNDVAELLYRLKSVNEGDEISDYNLWYSLEEFSELYGATFKIEDNKLSVSDPYFGFAFDNLPLEKIIAQNPMITQNDIFIYVSNPSGFENGYETNWHLLYPSTNEYSVGFTYFIEIRISSPDYAYEYDAFSEEEDLFYSVDCPVYAAWTVEEILDQVCVIDENQNIDAEYLNFQILD